MIYQTSHVFANSTAVRLVDLLGTDEVENFTIKKVGGEGLIYIGNETVSSISYGLSMDQFDPIYFPKISLKVNPNLHICGDDGVSVSILAWQ